MFTPAPQVALLNSSLAVSTREMVELLGRARATFLVQYGPRAAQAREIQDKLDFLHRMEAGEA